MTVFKNKFRPVYVQTDISFWSLSLVESFRKIIFLCWFKMNSKAVVVLLLCSLMALQMSSVEGNEIFKD